MSATHLVTVTNPLTQEEVTFEGSTVDEAEEKANTYLAAHFPEPSEGDDE